MKYLIAIALASMLAGCASMAPTWEKSGATQSEFDQAKQQCIYEVQLHNPGMGPFEALFMVKQCLKAKGWRNP